VQEPRISLAESSRPHKHYRLIWIKINQLFRYDF
jgi:hypothetical protein